MTRLIRPLLPAETWKRNQLAVTVAAALVFFGFTLVLPFLPYFVESLGVRGKAVDVWSGALLSMAPLLAALMAPFWARMAERYGMKLMVQRTMLAMAIHWILMLFVGTVWHLLVLRILLGVFSGFGTMSVALVTLGAPRERIGSAVGALQSAQILSAATGPFVGGILYETVGLRATFAVTASLCAAGLLLISAIYSDAPCNEMANGGLACAAAGAAPRLDGARLGFRSVFRLQGVLPIVFVLFWASAVSRSFGLVVPLFLKEIAGGSAGLGLLTGLTISIGSFAEAFSAFFLGRLASRRDPRQLLLASLAVAMILSAPMLFVRDPWELFVLRVLLGLAAGGALTLGYTMGGAIFPAGGRAVSYSVLSSASMLGGALGPIVSAAVSWAFGIRYNFALAAVLYGLLAMGTYAGVRREIAERAKAEASRIEKGPEEKPYMPLPR